MSTSEYRPRSWTTKRHSSSTCWVTVRSSRTRAWAASAPGGTRPTTARRCISVPIPTTVRPPGLTWRSSSDPSSPTSRSACATPRSRSISRSGRDSHACSTAGTRPATSGSCEGTSSRPDRPLARRRSVHVSGKGRDLLEVAHRRRWVEADADRRGVATGTGRLREPGSRRVHVVGVDLVDGDERSVAFDRLEPASGDEPVERQDLGHVRLVVPPVVVGGLLGRFRPRLDVEDPLRHGRSPQATTWSLRYALTQSPATLWRWRHRIS